VSTDPNKIENIDPKYYLFFTLAFLVGFSERLANDIVKRAEATLSPETEKEILKEVRETGQGLRETAHEVEEEVRETALEVRETAHEVEEEVRETALELRETPDRAEGEMKIIQPTTSDTSAGNSKTNPQH
jgi:glutamine synthetase type III